MSIPEKKILLFLLIMAFSFMVIQGLLLGNMVIWFQGFIGGALIEVPKDEFGGVWGYLFEFVQ